MDPPHRQRQPTGNPTGHLQVAAASSSRHPPPPSPSASRLSVNPPTPSATSDAASDYFDPLSRPVSTQSRYSIPRSRPTSGAGNFAGLRPGLEHTRQPSIRLRRSSNASIISSSTDNLPTADNTPNIASDGFHGRPRSISQPERSYPPDVPGVARHSRRVPQIAMPRLTEEGNRPTLAELGVDGTSPISPVRSLPDDAIHPLGQDQSNNGIDGNGNNRLQRGRKLSRMFWPGNYRRSTADAESSRASQAQSQEIDDEYAQELVDWLDIIDPEVQTLSTLTNVQNSLFIPDLGKLINRRPTYVLSQHEPEQVWARGAGFTGERRREPEQDQQLQEDVDEEPPPMQRSSTITSRLTESHYAALPHGTSLEGWSAQEKSELDDHVRHMLHSRRSRFKRTMRGFGQYVRRPLGFFVTLYATLITLFGLAWVLFLIGWIYVGEKQVYAIHIIDSILVALFAIMGDGLAPFRAVDTYHMIFIARYLRMIKRAEKGKRPRSRLRKRSIPDEVRDSVDLENGGRLTSHQAREILAASGPCASANTSEETRVEGDQPIELQNTNSSDSSNDIPALTMAQLKSLQHHQKKFAKSHSFYKPQETFTHHPFPLGYLMAIVILLDFHSCLQISLGACTWGIDYHVRPFALTTVILCVSITCNITAGLLITIGDRKTRKKDVMELLNRQELTGDAIKHLVKKKKKKEKEEEKEREQENSDRQSESSSTKIGKLVKMPS